MIDEVWGYLFSLLLDPWLNSIDFWRFTSIALLTAMAILIACHERVFGTERRAEIKTHDRAIFAHEAELFDESHLRELLYSVFNNMSFDSRLGVQADTLLDHARLTESQYLSASLAGARRDYLQTLADLRTFSAQHFYHPHRNLGDLYLEPGLDSRFSDYCEEHDQRYKELQVKLDSIVKDVTYKYERYRKQIKKKLSV